jgi:hypothetical protein
MNILPDDIANKLCDSKNLPNLSIQELNTCKDNKMISEAELKYLIDMKNKQIQSDYQSKVIPPIIPPRPLKQKPQQLSLPPMLSEANKLNELRIANPNLKQILLPPPLPKGGRRRTKKARRSAKHVSARHVSARHVSKCKNIKSSKRLRKKSKSSKTVKRH